MFRSYLLLATRNLILNKTSFINIVGLSLGMAAYFLLSQYVNFEMGYDRYHKHAENIYRLRHDTYKQGEFESSSAITYHAISPAIKETCPELINYVRMHRADGMLNYYGRRNEVISHHIFDAFYADSSFLSMFSFPLVAGNRANALRKPNTMLISATAAKQYFGDENPIGKEMVLTTQWQGGSYIIDGIFEDVPPNSHMKFDYLFPIANLLSNRQFISHGWYWTNFYNYLLLEPGTDLSAFERKLENVIDTHLGKDLRHRQSAEKFILQPLTAIHLHSNIGGEIQPNQNFSSVSGLLIISFLIMGIAWLNYINLSTVTATKRAKEIGIRKLMGSRHLQLICQFVLESCVISSIAFVIASIVVLCADSFFWTLIGHQVPLQLKGQFGLLYFVLPTLIAGNLLASVYSAVVLSSSKPVAVLKGNMLQSTQGLKMRKILIVAQFTCAIFLIVTTLTVLRQLEFMQQQSLGIRIKDQIVVRSPRLLTMDSYSNAMNEFKRKALSTPLIKGVTTSSEVPGKEIFWTNEFRKIEDEESVRHWMNIIVVDEDFINNYELALVSGRSFSQQYPTDFGSAIINMSALKRLGFSDAESAIGQQIIATDLRPKKIVGVISDFHQQSLKQVITPLVLYFVPWENDYYTISIDPGREAAAIKFLQSTFVEVFPNNAFEYFFLDNHFNQQYNSEKNQATVVTLITTTSLVVACMGIFGLSSFLVIQRKKEVAIRKILGASMKSIMNLLVNDYLKLLVISSLISIPITWSFLNAWMSQFAYRTNIPVIYFVIGSVLTAIIALATIAIHLLESARANPIDAMRRE